MTFFSFCPMCSNRKYNKQRNIPEKKQMTLASKTQEPNSHGMVEFHWDRPRGQMHPLTWDGHLCKRLCFNSFRGKTPVNTIPRNQ